MQRLFAIVLVACLGHVASAAELTGYVTLTSDFVRRGVSQSGAGPGFQADPGGGKALAAGASGYIVGRAVWREAATLDRRVRTDAIRDQVIPRLRTLEALPGSNGITIR